MPSLEEGPVASLAWDCATLLEAWLAQLHGLSYELLLTPTRSRGRSTRNLTVNVFHPFELLPRACVSGTFEWDPDLDGARETALGDALSVTQYARVRRDRWTAVLDERSDKLDPLRTVKTPRGALTLAALLAAQRWHVAFHYRQLIDFLDERAALATPPFPLDRLEDLDLPAELY